MTTRKARRTRAFTQESILGKRFKLEIGVHEIQVNRSLYKLPSYALTPADMELIAMSFKNFRLLLPDTRLTKDYPAGALLIYIDPTGLVTQVSKV